MSNNIDNARKNLDAKLSEMGYVHPETHTNLGGSAYKSYSETNDKVYVSQSNDPYAVFNADNNSAEKTVQQHDICPICDTKALYKCNCSVAEMMCKGNHMWYFTNTGTLIIGDPHETTQ